MDDVQTFRLLQAEDRARIRALTQFTLAFAADVLLDHPDRLSAFNRLRSAALDQNLRAAEAEHPEEAAFREHLERMLARVEAAISPPH